MNKILIVAMSTVLLANTHAYAIDVHDDNIAAHPAANNESIAAVANMSVATATYDAPAGWHRSDNKGIVTFTAPEQDAKLVIVAISSTKSAEAAAAAAWAIHDPNFARDIRLNTPAAADRGWDFMRRIEYQTSPSEKKLVYANVYSNGSQWQVVLLDGDSGTISKRRAALDSVFESFALEGYTPEDFSKLKPHPLTAERIELLKKFVSDSANSLSIPGVGFSLIQDGKVVFEGGVGVKSFDSVEPVDKNTKFMIASNTKGMTTLLLAKLVEMGKLRWDDRVIDHYPAFRLGDQKTTERVLVRHLVCACTGLPRKDFYWMFNNTPTTPASATFDDLAAMAPTSGFGELYQYNNQMPAAAGFLAGYILYPEMEIGAAYDKAMQTYIFDPLGMTETTFSMRQGMKGNFATPHALNIDHKIEIIEQTTDRGFNYLATAYRPSGAAWSSPHDLIKYIQNELTQGAGHNGKRLFAADPLLERRKPGVSAGKDRAYGMGLATKKIAGVEIVEHGGSLAGFRSQIVIIPGANAGAVILTNAEAGAALLSPFGRRLVEILYNGDEKAFGQVAVAAEIQRLNWNKFKQDLTIPADPKTVADLAKHYHSAELGSLDIRQVNGATVFDPGVWSSRIATKKNPDGTISVVLTEGFILGTEAVIGKANDKRTLTLIGAQHKYVFTEVDEGTKASGR
jgi:CubicO group peptidase (beta-lactamase class C family)